MFVLIRTFSAVVFNIITIIICWPKMNMIEVILKVLNLTIICSQWSTALKNMSAYDDPDIQAICSGLTIPLNFKSGMNAGLY